MKAVCLISGTGTNLQAIINNIEIGYLNIDLVSVISDKPNAEGLKRAKKAGIKTIGIDFTSYTDRFEYDAFLEKKVASIDPELIILSGYMKILPTSFCKRFSGRILNIHPSLLPKYKGLNTHQRVLDNKDDIHGASVHFVNSELDGGPIIIQYHFKINENDNTDSIKKKTQKGEYLIYSKAIKWLYEKRLSFELGKVFFDGSELKNPKIFFED